METHVQARVMPEAVIYTDEAPAYVGIAKKGRYDHKRIHHKANVYVVGDAHTNTIERFWSLVKRGIGGTRHAVSAKYLQGYLNEYAWRYNHRNNPQAMFWTLLLRAATRPAASTRLIRLGGLLQGRHHVFPLRDGNHMARWRLLGRFLILTLLRHGILGVRHEGIRGENR